MEKDTRSITTPLRLGVSACLLGQRVRHDGGHKKDMFLVSTWGRRVEFLPVCPEVEAGFGIPREPIRLQGDLQSSRVVTERTQMDRTQWLVEWTTRRVGELAQEGLWGFIFKDKSPSCGIKGVKVELAEGKVLHRGVGIFARAFMERFPNLPVIDDERFHDPEARDNFVEALFVAERWRRLRASGRGKDALETFHKRHDLLLSCRSTPHKRKLDVILARAPNLSENELYTAYEGELMGALRLKATPAKRAQGLDRAMKLLMGTLSEAEERELSDVLEKHRDGHLPFAVPLTLVSHYASKYDVKGLVDQYWLNPHHLELFLRFSA